MLNCTASKNIVLVMGQRQRNEIASSSVSNKEPSLIRPTHTRTRTHNHECNRIARAPTICTRDVFYRRHVANPAPDPSRAHDNGNAQNANPADTQPRNRTIAKLRERSLAILTYIATMILHPTAIPSPALPSPRPHCHDQHHHHNQKNGKEGNMCIGSPGVPADVSAQIQQFLVDCAIVIVTGTNTVGINMQHAHGQASEPHIFARTLSQ